MNSYDSVQKTQEEKSKDPESQYYDKSNTMKTHNSSYMRFTESTCSNGLKELRKKPNSTVLILQI